MLVVGLVFAPVSHAASGLKATPKVILQVRSYRIAHQSQILRDFISLLAIPNHASDPARTRDNANAIEELFIAHHVPTHLLETTGAPLVVAEFESPGARSTVTFYAHYDGQPVDLSAWASAPFTPTLLTQARESGGRPVDLEAFEARATDEWRLYARSASDDKAPIIGMLAALDALRAAGVRPSVNIRFVFEGEEEIGSPHLAEALEKYREDLKTDLWILCDGPVDQSGSLQAFFGARGVLALDITAFGPNRGLHSGHYGNWAPNPIVLLTHLLDGMRDTEAHVLIPGFYDDVQIVTDTEDRSMTALHDAILKRQLGIRRSEGEPATLSDQLVKPALNVHGFAAGHVGETAANVIVSEAKASIDFRLVPNQSPESVRRLVEEHIANQGFWITDQAPTPEQRETHDRIVMLSWAPGSYPGARTPIDAPLSRKIVEVIEGAIGGHVLRTPMLGGSIPMYLFKGRDSAPVVGVPIANFDNNQHSANENIRLGNLWTGIEIYAALFAKLGNTRLPSTAVYR